MVDEFGELPPDMYGMCQGAVTIVHDSNTCNSFPWQQLYPQQLYPSQLYLCYSCILRQLPPTFVPTHFYPVFYTLYGLYHVFYILYGQYGQLLGWASGPNPITY